MQYINRKFNSFLPDSGQIHNPFLPADIYTGDPVSARLRVDDTTGEFNQLPVWKISPLGVELLATQQNFCNWKPGMHVDLILTIGKQHSEFRNVTVSTVTKNHDRTLLGISWPRSKITHYPIVDQRTAKRFICGSDFFPTGIFNNSIRYKDFIYFRIQDISSTGMQLLTSLRNKLIVPGMTFESTCSFPMENQVQISIKIVNTRIVTSNGKVYLSLGVAHDARKEHVLTTIGQYLLQFGSGASLQELREAGFRVKSSSRAFNFGYAKSEEEYQQVLELRRIAYVHASKVSSDTSAKSMADEFDAKSRILIALYHSRVIGSVRLIFPQSELDALKHEEYTTLPTTLPRKDCLIEVQKACTHPQFQGNDLIYYLFKHIVFTALRGDRRYVLMSCTDKLRPRYENVGCESIGVTYIHPTMGLKHHIMLADAISLAQGRGINPKIWNMFDGPEMCKFVTECGWIPSDITIQKPHVSRKISNPLITSVIGTANICETRESIDD